MRHQQDLVNASVSLHRATWLMNLASSPKRDHITRDVDASDEAIATHIRACIADLRKALTGYERQAALFPDDEA